MKRLVILRKHYSRVQNKSVFFFTTSYIDEMLKKLKVTLLKLENGTVAVNSSADIEAVMFNREFVAGVEFDIPAVNIMKTF